MRPYSPAAGLPDGLTDKPVVPADIGHHSGWMNHAYAERLEIITVGRKRTGSYWEHVLQPAVRSISGIRRYLTL